MTRDDCYNRPHMLIGHRVDIYMDGRRCTGGVVTGWVNQGGCKRWMVRDDTSARTTHTLPLSDDKPDNDGFSFCLVEHHKPVDLAEFIIMADNIAMEVGRPVKWLGITRSDRKEYLDAFNAGMTPQQMIAERVSQHKERKGSMFDDNELCAN